MKDQYPRLHKACTRYYSKLPNTIEADDLLSHAIMIWLTRESEGKTNLNPAFIASEAYMQVSGDGTIGRSSPLQVFRRTGPRNLTEPLTPRVMAKHNSSMSKQQEQARDAFIDLGKEKTEFLQAYTVFGEDSSSITEWLDLVAKAEALGYDSFVVAYQEITKELEELL